MFKIEELKKEVLKDPSKIKILEVAKNNMLISMPYIAQYEGIGSKKVAQEIISHIDMTAVNHSIINENIKRLIIANSSSKLKE